MKPIDKKINIPNLQALERHFSTKTFIGSITSNLQQGSNEIASIPEYRLSKEKLLSPSEVSEMLGIKKNTLSIWKCVQRYQLPVIKIGRLVRYKLSDVEQFIQNNTQYFNRGEENE